MLPTITTFTTVECAVHATPASLKVLTQHARAWSVTAVASQPHSEAWVLHAGKAGSSGSLR
jgi:hypothetical protein